MNFYFFGCEKLNKEITLDCFSGVLSDQNFGLEVTKPANLGWKRPWGGGGSPLVTLTELLVIPLLNVCCGIEVLNFELWQLVRYWDLTLSLF